MSTVLPEGEIIRRAIKWISEHLQENPNQSTQKLVSDAILRFDMSPKDAEFLTRFYSQKEESRE